MEFNFRANNGRDSMYGTRSSSYSYFTEQAIRAGFPNRFAGLHGGVFRNPFDLHSTIQRELEKERIREEIIAEEIARKRVLEAEVRRELMMEREMGFRKADGFPHRLLHQSPGRSFEDRIASSLQERYGGASYGQFETGRLETVSFQPKFTEIIPSPQDNKEKPIISLGEASISLSGVKRKAVTPPAASGNEQHSAGSKKKPTEEWSCAFCQVTATSERGLNEHLMGKKHLSKEAALRAKKTGGNVGLGLPPKKTKPAKLAEVTGTRNLEQRDSHADGEKKDGEQLNADDSNREDEKTREQRRKKFKFWCEMCQVGTFSEKVMNYHIKGKKHVARTLETPNRPQNNKKAKDLVKIVGLEPRKVKVMEEVAEEETKKMKGLEQAETKDDDLKEVAEEAEAEKEVPEEAETKKEDFEDVPKEAETLVAPKMLIMDVIF